MIIRLKGQLVEKKPPNLCVDVQGVGYHVLVSMNTFYSLPDIGETVVLHIHHWIREDAQVLYGFSESYERELFRQLIKTNGVGPKMAITLLSGMSPKEFVDCIQSKNVAALVRLPGVGKKTAERLVVEMSDPLRKLIEDTMTFYPRESQDQVHEEHTSNPVQDAISALVALGYENKKANQVIRQCATPTMDRETLIREALKRLF